MHMKPIYQMKTQGDIYTGLRGYFSSISLISDYPVSQIPITLMISFLSGLLHLYSHQEEPWGEEFHDPGASSSFSQELQIHTASFPALEIVTLYVFFSYIIVFFAKALSITRYTIMARGRILYEHIFCLFIALGVTGTSRQYKFKFQPGNNLICLLQSQPKQYLSRPPPALTGILFLDNPFTECVTLSSREVSFFIS